MGTSPVGETVCQETNERGSSSFHLHACMAVCATARAWRFVAQTGSPFPHCAQDRDAVGLFDASNHWAKLRGGSGRTLLRFWEMKWADLGAQSRSDFTPARRALSERILVSNAQGVQDTHLQRVLPLWNLNRGGVSSRARTHRGLPASGCRPDPAVLGENGRAAGAAGHHHPRRERLLAGDAAEGLGRCDGGSPAQEPVQLLHLLHGILRCGVRGWPPEWQREQEQRPGYFGEPGGRRRGELRL